MGIGGCVCSRGDYITVVPLYYSGLLIWLSVFEQGPARFWDFCGAPGLSNNGRPPLLNGIFAFQLNWLLVLASQVNVPSPVP